MRLVWVGLLCAVAAACGGAAAPGVVADVAAVTEPGPQVRGQDDATSRKSPNPGGPLIDHGGAVLETSTTYAIYWGDQSAFPSDLKASMTSLFQGFERSSYLAIANQYMRGSAAVTSFGTSYDDTSAPPSHSPKTSAIGAEVCKLVASPDPSGIYFVFTSNAPKANFCAWHDKATCNGVTFQVAYVPNQALIPGCSPFTRKNLNCNNFSEGTVSSADSVAHEYMEATTDPHLDAWYDQSGGEIADKCNFDYQACVQLSNGTSWQIQSEWSNAISGCQQQ
jgi:hypothetical protein